MRLLLRCMEEAMKRNGDVTLTALPVGAANVLNRTGVSNLFDIFATNAEAVSRVEQMSRKTPMHITSYGDEHSGSKICDRRFDNNHSGATSLRRDNDNVKSLD